MKNVDIAVPAIRGHPQTACNIVEFKKNKLKRNKNHAKKSKEKESSVIG